jgi:hypothetical protein
MSAESGGPKLDEPSMCRRPLKTGVLLNGQR